MDEQTWQSLAKGHSHDLEYLFALVTDWMRNNNDAGPSGGWKDRDGIARTPVYALPSVNYHRKYVAGQVEYEVQFISRTGEFRIMKAGKQVAVLQTRF